MDIDLGVELEPAEILLFNIDINKYIYMTDDIDLGVELEPVEILLFNIDINKYT